MLKKYSQYILCFLIALFIAALYVNNFSPLERLEWKIQDLMFSMRSDNDKHGNIVLVEIDNKAIKEFGEWPWPNDRIGDLLAAIGQGNPKTVLMDLYINPDVSLDSTRQTEILAGQMSWMKNVFVPYDYSPTEYMSNKISNPRYLFNYSLQVNNELGILDDDESELARKVFLPPAIVCEYAAGLGFKATNYDDDRVVRWEPMALYYDGYYYPSHALLAAAHFKDIGLNRIKVYSKNYIQVGGRQIPINDKGRYFINYNKPNKSFARVSASDILNEAYPPERFANKMIIVGLSSEDNTEYLNTPVWDKMPATRKTANVVENIIDGNFIDRLDTNPLIGLIILLVIGLAFAFVLPRVTSLQRGIILGSALIAYLMATYILLDSMNILIRPLYLSIELILLFFAGPLLEKDYLERVLVNKFGLGEKSEDIQKSTSTTPKKKKQHVEEAQFSTMATPIEVSKKEADIKFQQEETIADGAQISATTPVDGSAIRSAETGQDPVHGDYAAVNLPASDEEVPMEYRPPSLQSDPDEIDMVAAPANDAEPVSQPEAPKQSDGDGIIINDGSNAIGNVPDLKNLGRYKVMGVLGKGAMGTVYKGIDPAIDRNVALKTIRLDFVNDPAELEELKERLSREAKAAGMLSHPNIVTIYDVGSEGNLQYIAMEYLEGQTLEEMIKKKVKFNYRIIAQIITQICTALDYAHNQGIVHRDIKPANIMVTGDYRTKVMDFGIARVDSSSMTRTGIAMGTPNYISPEQLQGRSVDRRCDIFSLGVVMYEMLLHRRPFKGENLTSLIYNIVNADPELPSKVNPSIPHLFDRVIDKALKKDPAERYQHASEISAALSDFVQSFISN